MRLAPLRVAPAHLLAACGLVAPLLGGAAAGPSQDDDPPRSRQAADEPDDEPPARAKVAGIDSLWIRTEVRFAAEGAAPHHMDTALAFPARCRIELRPEGGRDSARVLRYRRGAALYGLELGSQKSHRIEEPERARELLQIELRLAAFVFPEAHDWRPLDAPDGGAPMRVAHVPGAGSLVAQLDAGSGLPTRIAAHRTSGESLEVLEIQERSTDPQGRAWPLELALRDASGLVWTERVTAVDRRVLWADDWFTPPDRRSRASQPVEGERAVDLEPQVVRDVPFESTPKSIDEALERARRGREAAAAEVEALGCSLEPGLCLVLGPDLEPRAVRWTLGVGETPRRTIPEGWSETPPRPGRVALLDTVGGITGRRVAALERAFGARPQERGREVEVLVTASGSGPGSIRLTLAKRAQGDR